MKYLILLITFLISGLIPIHIQAYTPFVKNYSKNDYAGASQNWCIKQDLNGYIYVGNHYGLLRYTGSQWQLFPLRTGLKKAVRSILLDQERIYVGSMGEFGYFEESASGNLIYHSLSEKVKAIQMKQIWSIVEDRGNILFQYFGGYYSYNGQEVKHHKTPTRLQIIHSVDQNRYTVLGNQFGKMENASFVPLKMNQRLINWNLEGVMPLDDESLLLLTEKQGMFKYQNGDILPWKNNLADEIQKAKPNKCIQTQDSLLIVGTILNGIYALDQNGTIQWHLNTENGLQNNTVLNITCDKDNNVWASLDNGISMIYSGSSVLTHTFEKNIGFIYDVDSLDNHFYFATNQGLYRTDQHLNQVSLVNGSEGYIVNLRRLGPEQLLIGHGRRTYTMGKDQQLKLLSKNASGGSCVKPVPGKKVLIAQGSYSGLHLFQRGKKGWMLRDEFKGVSPSVQSFEVTRCPQGYTIWGAHAAEGITQFTFDADFKTLLKKKKYPQLSSEGGKKLGVFRLRNKIVFLDGNAVYHYDAANDQFTTSQELNQQLGYFAKAHRIVQINKDLYWFITHKNAALVSFKGSNLAIDKIIDYQALGFIMLDDFENIVPINNDYSLLCFLNGVAKIPHRSIQLDAKESITPLLVQNVKAYNEEDDSYNLPLDGEEDIEVNYDFNNLLITISYAQYDRPITLEYRDKSQRNRWTALDKEGKIHLRRLKHGKHQIEFRAVDLLGQIRGYNHYHFEVTPPFYASMWGYLLYAGLLGCIIVSIYWITKRRTIQKEKKIREKQEMRIMQLENEKLSNELIFKSKEITATTMHIIQKKELLQTIKKELSIQKEELGNKYPAQLHKRMMSIIDHNSMSDEEWEIFQSNFDLIHDSFFRNLRANYPMLSAQDLKLCALLRLNLDTKQIANMLNITVRGVENKRYRLRKKMNLETEVGLTEFFVDFK